VIVPEGKDIELEGKKKKEGENLRIEDNVLVGQDAEELLQVEIHHRVVASRKVSKQYLLLSLGHRSNHHAAPSETILGRQSISDHQSSTVLKGHCPIK